jgi:hypothetical protein
MPQAAPPAIHRIVREAVAHEYSLTSLVVGVIKSLPFQMRNVPLATKQSTVTAACQ